MWVWKKINVQPVIIVSFLLLPNVNMINYKILNQSITVLTRFCSMNFINDTKNICFPFHVLSVMPYMQAKYSPGAVFDEYTDWGTLFPEWRSRCNNMLSEMDSAPETGGVERRLWQTHSHSCILFVRPFWSSLSWRSDGPISTCATYQYRGQIKWENVWKTTSTPFIMSPLRHESLKCVILQMNRPWMNLYLKLNWMTIYIPSIILFVTS